MTDAELRERAAIIRQHNAKNPGDREHVVEWRDGGGEPYVVCDGVLFTNKAVYKGVKFESMTFGG